MLLPVKVELLKYYGARIQANNGQLYAINASSYDLYNWNANYFISKGTGKVIRR